MESALIVSSSKTSIAAFAEILRATSCDQIVTSETCGAARRLMIERDFDLVIVNAPLRDESGESLAREIAGGGISQVILVVKREFFDAVASNAEADGVLTVAKPLNKEVFWSALRLAQASCTRFKRMQAENSKLKQKIEDIRVVDRAKCILISHMDMSEQDAHRYIEKQAMDMRVSKRIIAEGILKTYEY